VAWESFLSIVREAAQTAAEERARPPSACPTDGEPLESARGVLHCPFCGHVADGTTAG